AGAPGAAASFAHASREEVAAAGEVRSDSRFVIGSVTKTFVGALVLRLAEEGRLALDEPAQRWCELAPADVTIRMLLDHTSRIPNYFRVPGVVEAYLREPKRVWAPRELVRLVAGREPAWRYWNTNSILLGLVIEAVTKLTLEAALQRWVLDPLGLATSELPRSGDRVDLARGHGPKGLEMTDADPSIAWAARAMVSTSR